MVKNIILVSGKLQSGKNSFTDMLIEELKKLDNNLKIDFDLFAKSVKDQCKDIFKNLISYLNEVSVKNDIPEIFTVEDNWYENKNKITRILLQTYGTDIFRDMIDSDHWAKILKYRMCERNEDILFVTDVRFKSEIKVICDKEPFQKDYRVVNPKYNIMKVRIERDNFVRDDNPIHNHQSEIDLDDYENWDVLIRNEGTLEELRLKARMLALKIKQEMIDG